MTAFKRFVDGLKAIAALGQDQRRRTAVISPADIFGEIATSNLTGFQKFLSVGSGRVWASFKACDIVGKIITDTPLKITRNGKPEAVEIQGLTEILKTANPYEAFSEILYKTVFHLKLAGNAFWVKDGANQLGDRPVNIYALNPSKIEIMVNKKIGITGYLYNVNGVKIPFGVEEIIHFRNPHPSREFYGLGEVEAGVGLFDEFVNRGSWANQFWKNGASPSGILIIEDVGAAQSPDFEKLKRKFQAEYGGTANSGKTAFLAGKWSYERIGLSASEMQDTDKEKENVKSIFHLHGIPLSVAGIEGAANFATARVSDVQLRRYTVRPMIKLISDTLNSDLVLGFDQNAAILFELQGMTDLEQVATMLVPLFDRGAISINELRVAAGYERIDDPIYEQHMVNAGLVPLDLSGITQDQNASAAAQRIINNFVDRSLLPREKT